MWSEDITDVNGIAADRIRAAVEKAGEAFFDSVAASFPEAESGDFGPGETVAIENAMNAAVVTWLAWNVPAPSTVKLKRVAALVGGTYVYLDPDRPDLPEGITLGPWDIEIGAVGTDAPTWCVTRRHVEGSTVRGPVVADTSAEAAADWVIEHTPESAADPRV